MRLLLLFCIGLLWSIGASAQGIIALDTAFIALEDCALQGEVCLEDFPPFQAFGYDILVDGAPYDGLLMGCQLDTLYAYSLSNFFISPTLFNVDSWTLNAQQYAAQFSTFSQLADSMNVWDPIGDWTYSATNQLISGGNPLNIYGNMLFTVLMPDTFYVNAGPNLGINALGTLLQFGQGFHEVIFQNAIGQGIDTVYVDASCVVIPPTAVTEVINDTLLIGEMGSWCNPEWASNDSIYFDNDPSSYEFVAFSLDTISGCMEYAPIAPWGQDTMLVVHCFDGLCDTTYLVVTTIDSIPLGISVAFSDTIEVSEQGQWCPPLDNGTAELLVFPYCGDPALASIGYISEPGCLNYQGNAVGQDTFCFVYCPIGGNCDTAYLILTIVPTVPDPTVDFVIDTFTVGETFLYPIDIGQLGNPIASIINFCGDSENLAVDFTINELSLTLEIVATSPGLDSACITVCDITGVCDTTFYYITVQDSADAVLPDALDDVFTTYLDTPLTFDVSQNDLNLLLSTVISVLPNWNNQTLPANGMLLDIGNGVYGYEPNNGFCGLDSFAYQLCEGAYCDTALVIINVGCPETLVIYNAFSPNDDNINDKFVIEGLNTIPNNRLVVFSRWGTQVLAADRYANDWSGTWDGKEVPDGIYFYLLTDIDTGETRSGYLTIMR